MIDINTRIKNKAIRVFRKSFEEFSQDIENRFGEEFKRYVFEKADLWGLGEKIEKLEHAKKAFNHVQEREISAFYNAVESAIYRIDN